MFEVIKIGDLIVIANYNRKTKFESPSEGPYWVINICPNNIIKIWYKGKEKILHLSQTRKFLHKNLTCVEKKDKDFPLTPFKRLES